MSVRLFDQFLEISGPSGERRARAFGLDRHSIQRLQEEYSPLIRLGTPAAQIRALLGEPHTQGDACIGYELPSRVGYVFIFHLHADGTLVRASFSRTSGGQKSVKSGGSIPKLADQRKLGATEDEVRSWYGEPDEIIGWWPMEVWRYGPKTIELRLGIVH